MPFSVFLLVYNKGYVCFCVLGNGFCSVIAFWWILCVFNWLYCTFLSVLWWVFLFDFLWILFRSSWFAFGWLFKILSLCSWWLGIREKRKRKKEEIKRYDFTVIFVWCCSFSVVNCSFRNIYLCLMDWPGGGGVNRWKGRLFNAYNLEKSNSCS